MEDIENPKERKYLNLFQKQRKNIPDLRFGNTIYGKLSFQDIVRLDSFIDTDIFDLEKCAKYHSHHTNGILTAFSYETKKISLHKILYHNYIADIEPNTLYYTTCKNDFACANVHHITKKVI